MQHLIHLISNDRSWKPEIRRNHEIYSNSIFNGLYQNINILVKKDGSLNEILFFESINKVDPWVDLEKDKLDV